MHTALLFTYYILFYKFANDSEKSDKNQKMYLILKEARRKSKNLKIILDTVDRTQLFEFIWFRSCKCDISTENKFVWLRHKIFQHIN